MQGRCDRRVAGLVTDRGRLEAGNQRGEATRQKSAEPRLVDAVPAGVELKRRVVIEQRVPEDLGGPGGNGLETPCELERGQIHVGCLPVSWPTDQWLYDDDVRSCLGAAVVFLATFDVVAAETMRIALERGATRVTITGSRLRAGPDADVVTWSNLQTDRVVLVARDGAVAIEGGGRSWPAVQVAGETDEAALTVGKQGVRGAIAAIANGDKLLLVNVLPLEAYLEGVLGSEMPPGFPLEALKAQAVAARTYALRKKIEQFGQPVHLGSSVISQVYKGLEAEDPRTRQAVEQTRGQILTADLEPIEAYFHASCGGRTESGAEALGRPLPYLKSVSCPCSGMAPSRWEMLLPQREIKERFAGAGNHLEVMGRTGAGRARRVSLGDGRSIDAVTFREKLGYGRVKSLWFDVTKGPAGYTLKGHGSGHGAGLCQWGAKGLAEQGRTYTEILSHYYPGTELQTLY